MDNQIGNLSSEQKWYNEEIKRVWIELYLSNKDMVRSTVESVFSASKKMESLLEKDICNFSKPEIESYYKSLSAKSKERISVANSILKEYKEWCYNNGYSYDSNPYYDTFTSEDFKRCISKSVLEKKYIGEDTLNSYLAEIHNPCDRLLLILLYNSIRGKLLEEILNLHVNQIEGNIIHLSTGREVRVDDSVINLIYLTNDTYTYYTYGEIRKFELVGDNVFKNTKGVRTTSMASVYHRYASRIVKFQQMFDNPELAINRIWISGMLNALIKKANEKNLTLGQFTVTEEAKPILKQYEFNRHPTKIMKLFEEYIEYIK